MLIKILAGLLALVVLFAIVVSFQPATFRVVRSATIAAPANVVFAQINDFHKMEVWSPWAKMDPAMKTTFSGPEAGPGASYAWAGNSQVGEGRLTIVESKPYERIQYRQEFFKPMKGVNTAEFTFTPQGDRTLVTWTMFGDQNFVAKAFGLFVSMDKMIGGTFEQGLANLRTIAESEVKKP
ncbi:polyketide cyclase [Opitutaceae bacterium EW11]|nr:polyketide cyclase [Opitutaceae bacterium EW11]